MNKIFFGLIILFFTGTSYADIIFLKDYSNLNKIKIDGVLAVTESQSDCSGYLFIDKIKSYNYDKGIISFETLKKHDFSIYYEIGKIDFNDSPSLIEILSSKEDMVFIGERCGFSGKIFSIYSLVKLKKIK